MAKTGGRVGTILLAAGDSQRMNGIDKVFTLLLGHPLITYSLIALANHPLIDEVVLVVAPNRVKQACLLIAEGDWPHPMQVCAGGLRRQDSVARGLESLAECEWIVVHDGARPCLEPTLVQHGLEAALKTGAAVSAIPIVDTLKRVDSQNRVVETPPRNGLWAAQTPQVFRRELLVEAHRRISETVTDDATMVELLGYPVQLFSGSSTNVKVTTPEDLVLAEAILRTQGSAQG